ncbi:MAG: hypothetical protein JNL85_08870 [Rubrivivax sp.]|nr:hypothetical protein [Rubrivivax sp.]
MKDWNSALRAGLWTGGAAGLVSMAMLAWRGRLDTGKPYGAINAPSHWVWGDKALRKNEPSWRYTGLGVAIHHASAVLWGVLFERYVARARPTAAQQVRDAALATGTAAAVDFVLTPRRLRPGFERRLSLPSLVVVYAGFAAGLAIGSALAGRQAGGRGRREVHGE